MTTPTQYGDSRNELILRQVEDYHGFAVPLPNVQPQAGEMRLDGPWRIAAAPACEIHAEDLAAFLQRMGVTLSQKADTANVIELAIDASPAGGFAVHVQQQRVTLRGCDSAMMWRAMARLERTMAYRHAPILPIGKRTIKPHLDMRITTSMFAHGLEDPADPLAYTDDNLRHMAHLGYNNFFLYVNLWRFTDSKLLPELSAAEAAAKREDLRRLVARAARYGLTLTPLIAAPRLEAEHPVFARKPELKGGIVMRKTGHALCTSQPLTHEFYAEQMGELARDVPGLGAFAFLIGGEGFLHCYTRAVPRTDRVTNCPRCGQQRPSQVLTPLLNSITAAVKDASPETRVIFWPYSSAIWQDVPAEDYDWAEDRAIIAKLDRRASWLLEIDINHVFELPGVGKTYVSDYSLQFVGPSSKLLTVKPAMDEAGIELVVKTETNVDAGFHCVPYIPAMQRWAARHRAIQQTGAPVSWDTWRFNGLWESPSVEVAFWMDVEPQLSDEAIVRRIATRIYGSAAADDVMQGWQYFSDAWQTVYRQYGPYWMGPLVLGPAHLFDLGHAFIMPWTYGPGFFEIPAGMRESENEMFLADPRHLSPRFCTIPLGHVPERLRDLGRAAALTKKGAAII